MATTDTSNTAGKTVTRPASPARSEAGGYGSAEISESEQGTVSIADTVVAKIVGMAARDVQGVYAMGSGIGSGMNRSFGAMRDRIPGAGAPSVTQGISVEVGQYQAAVDLDVIVEYGVSIPDVAAGIRRNVVASVERMCGLQATEVNISIGDVHLPGSGNSDDSDSAEPRVQ
jgi:uncharacterized alkaline shock family protein YloU